MMTSALELQGVGKVFAPSPLARLLGRGRPVRAVHDVSVRLEPGGVLGIIGESGCGKSTLARMILRLEAPTAGRILVAGQDLVALRGDALRRARQGIGMVFQDPGGSLNPRKTVRRTLGESLGLGGVARGEREDQAVALLERVGLGAAQMGQHPHALSGGQKQRVAIARALALRPALLVADEPVSALDVSLQAQVIRLLMRLREELGLTMVFISHDLALVHHLCTQVMVMQAGQVVEQGPPAEVLHRPRHAYTRSLLEAIPRPPMA